MKDDFLATVSHEFKTPLNGITGMLELLVNENSRLKESQKEKLEVIGQCSAVLQMLVGNVLIQSREISCIYSSVNTRKLFEHAVSIIRSLGSQKVILKIKKNVPETMEICEQFVLQVLLNLGSNAVKFSKAESQIEVEVIFFIFFIFRFLFFKKILGLHVESPLGARTARH
jgi:signal transduction histidine kinase